MVSDHLVVSGINIVIADIPMPVVGMNYASVDSR
jgi:hypothetical protein